jgi:hypothetical protein
VSPSAIGESEHRSIARRRAERELFFWTVRQALLLTILAAFAAHSIACVLAGDVPALTPLLRLAET